MELPLAFSIVAHGHLGLLEAQLASLFRSHNSFCIYVDKKAPDVFRRNVQNLVQCYQDHFAESLIFIGKSNVQGDN